LVDAQGKSAITRSVAGGGDLIEQRTLNFNSMRRQKWSSNFNHPQCALGSLVHRMLHLA
jgi:hypothetical protein